MRIHQQVRPRQVPDLDRFSTPTHPHGLVPWAQRRRVRYGDDSTGNFPGGISLNSGSAWPKVLHVNRNVRRSLERAGVSL